MYKLNTLATQLVSKVVDFQQKELYNMYKKLNLGVKY